MDRNGKKYRGQHCSQKEIKEFTWDRITGSAARKISEHLLECHSCADLAYQEFDTKYNFEKMTVHKPTCSKSWFWGMKGQIKDVFRKLVEVSLTGKILATVTTIFLFVFIGFGLRFLLPSTSGIKGEIISYLHLYKKTGASIIELDNKAIVGDDDLLQIGFSTIEEYAAVFSIDDTHKVSYLFPPDGVSAVKLTSSKGDEVILQFAFKLNNTDKYEIFVLVTSPNPFTVHEVAEYLSSREKLSRSPRQNRDRLKVKTFILYKGEKNNE